jgi:hypothetical protein
MIPLADLEQTARDIGGVIAEAIRKSRGHGKVGFALMLFDFGAGGNSTYVSNAERQDMILALEELLGHLKAGTDAPPIPPHQKRH